MSLQEVTTTQMNTTLLENVTMENIRWNEQSNTILKCTQIERVNVNKVI